MVAAGLARPRGRDSGRRNRSGSSAARRASRRVRCRRAELAQAPPDSRRARTPTSRARCGRRGGRESADAERRPLQSGCATSRRACQGGAPVEIASPGARAAADSSVEVGTMSPSPSRHASAAAWPDAPRPAAAGHALESRRRRPPSPCSRSSCRRGISLPTHERVDRVAGSPRSARSEDPPQDAVDRVEAGASRRRTPRGRRAPASSSSPSEAEAARMRSFGESGVDAEPMRVAGGAASRPRCPRCPCRSGARR